MQRFDHGGDSDKSSIDEFIERITRMQKMPSVIADYPVEKHDQEHPRGQTKFFGATRDHQHRAPEMHKKARDPHKVKVHFSEHERAIEIGRDEKIREVYEEKAIDLVADGYIMQKHKNFESRYDTFKAY